MSQLEHLQVFQSMHSSPNTRLHRSAELGDGLAAAVWSNRHDARDYEAPSHHTLSCYLAGGTGTFRRESPHSKGAPDKLCILPAGHQSEWVINGEIHLAHLYISQEQFALAAVNLLDREPRELELREGTFLDDPQQAQRFRQLSQLDWQEPAERLLSLERYRLPALLWRHRNDDALDELLEPLQRIRAKDASGQLIATLRAWCAHDGQSQACADALGIHRNSLRYRLERVAELGEVDPLRMEGMLSLYLGLQLLPAG